MVIKGWTKQISEVSQEGTRRQNPASDQHTWSSWEHCSESWDLSARYHGDPEHSKGVKCTGKAGQSELSRWQLVGHIFVGAMEGPEAVVEVVDWAMAVEPYELDRHSGRRSWT